MTLFSRRLLCLLLVPMLTACVAAPTATSGEQRPMDEVPVQRTMPDGNREYGFANGCIILIEPKRAVVVSEGAVCKLHHRDIALLYAAGD